MTNLPYVAPWQTGFTRYSTQLVISDVRGGGAQCVFTIPDGQWWRVVWVSVSWTLDGGAASRTILMDIHTPENNGHLFIQSPLTLTAFQTGTFTFFPGASAFAATTDADHQYGQVPIPDMLWIYGTTFTLNLTNFVGTEQLNVGPFAAVEIYTEDYPGVLIPAALTPTPLLV